MVTNRLEKTQQLLYMSMEDVLGMVSDSKNEQRHCMIEKDKLLRELDFLREQLRPDQFDSLPGSSDVVTNVRSLNGMSRDPTSRQYTELQVRRHSVLL